MEEKVPKWAKQLTKDITELKKQTLTNCNKLTVLDKKFSKEIPLIRVRLDTLCTVTKNTESHLNRIERKVIKIENKL